MCTYERVQQGVCACVCVCVCVCVYSSERDVERECVPSVCPIASLTQPILCVTLGVRVLSSRSSPTQTSLFHTLTHTPLNN